MLKKFKEKYKEQLALLRSCLLGIAISSFWVYAFNFQGKLSSENSTILSILIGKFSFVISTKCAAIVLGILVVSAISVRAFEVKYAKTYSPEKADMADAYRIWLAGTAMTFGGLLMVLEREPTIILLAVAVVTLTMVQALQIASFHREPAFQWGRMHVQSFKVFVFFAIGATIVPLIARSMHDPGIIIIQAVIAGAVVALYTDIASGTLCYLLGVDFYQEVEEE